MHHLITICLALTSIIGTLPISGIDSPLKSIRSRYGDNSDECPRIRKAWHLLSDDEKQFTVDAMLELRHSGYFDDIASVHKAPCTGLLHQSSANFLWHSYLLWEVEARIRTLQPEDTRYACFAMPYYDFTIDYMLEQHPSIVEEGYFGAWGDPNNEYAVQGYSWPGVTRKDWTVPFERGCIADGDVFPSECSIKRIPVSDDKIGTIIASPYQLMTELTSDEFSSYEALNREMGYRNMAVNMLAGDHTAEDNTATIHVGQPYEPIWWLFHSFAQYQLSMWAQCHQYDQIDVQDLHLFPALYTEWCGGVKTRLGEGIDCKSWIESLSDAQFERLHYTKDDYYEYSLEFGLDDVLDFHPLDQTNWAYVAENELTIRELYDIRNWNIRYEVGTFWQHSGSWFMQKCKLNEAWFVDDKTLYDDNDEQEEEMSVQNEYRYDQEVKTAVDYVEDDVWYAVTLVLLVLLAMVLMGWLLKRKCSRTNRKKRERVSNIADRNADAATPLLP